MNIFLTYIFEVNLYIVLFGVSYAVFFKNEPYHRLNRAVILSSIFLSFLIPSFSFPGSHLAVNQVVNLDPVLISAQSTVGHSPAGYNFPSLLSLVYWVGFAVSCFFILQRILALKAIRGMGQTSTQNGIRVVKTDKLKSPASFFKTIYLTKNLEGEMLESIVAHERAHIHEMHSLDLLFMQLVQAFCWFNPVLYKLKNSLEATHEFRADEMASENQKNKIPYIELLISQALHINPKMLAHQFSKSNHLKRRIMMLHKPQKRGTSMVKYFLLIPIISGVLFLNACTEENPTDNSNNEAGSSQEMTPDNGDKKMDAKEMDATERGTKNMDKMDSGESTEMNKVEGTDIYTVADKMPAYPGGDKAMMSFLGDNIEYPADCKEEGVEGTVYITFVVDKSGKPTNMKALRSPDERLSANAMEVIGKMPAWTPGENDGKPVKVQYNLPIKYQLRK